MFEITTGELAAAIAVPIVAVIVSICLSVLITYKVMKRAHVQSRSLKNVIVQGEMVI